MDAITFKSKLVELNITQSQAAKDLAVTPESFRVTLGRFVKSGEQVPANWERLVTLAVTQTPDVTEKSVTKPECNNEGVTGPLTVLIPWKEDKAFDILSDGYARGSAGDSDVMRMLYRTPAAWWRHTNKPEALKSGRQFRITKDLKQVFA